MQPAALIVLLIALALLAGATAFRAPAAVHSFLPVISVGGNVSVSAAYPHLEHYELIGAADPADANRVIACTTAFSGPTNTRENIVYSSFDGGKAWTPTFVDTLGSDGWVGDPSCTFGLDGHAYYVSMTFYHGSHLTQLLTAYESSDGGRTWKLIATRSIIDRDYVLVDKTRSRYRGNVYVYGDGWGADIDPRGRHTADLELSLIRNGHFTAKKFPPGYDKFSNMNPGEGVITDDGTLVMPFDGIFASSGQWQLGIVTSSDGGATLSKPLVLAQTEGDLPMMAIDRSSGPFHGRIYLVYDGTVGTRGGSATRWQFSVVHSDDKGKTWSAPEHLHQDDPLPGRAADSNENQPTVAVNGNGVVGVSWYDTHIDPNNKAYNLRFAVSHDGGESFDPSVAVTNATYDLLRTNQYDFPAYVASGGAFSSNHPVTDNPMVTDTGPDYFIESLPGDTRAMPATSDGIFHPFWYDNRAGVLQLYTAAVAVSGQSWRNGDPSLEGLHDLNPRVTLRYRSERLDPRTGDLQIAASLVNRSNTPIHGPVKLRLLWVESQCGKAIAVNAANEFAGPGAIWDFSGALTGEKLDAWAVSRPIVLEFNIRHLELAQMRFPALTFETRAFGR